MLNCKTKQNYNNIVMEIIKQHVGTYFYFRYRKKNSQQRRQTGGEFYNASYTGKLMSHVFNVSLLCDI
jgi:hypothetical protein